MISILGLILSLAALIYLSFKRWNGILASLIATLILGITNKISVGSILFDYYMTGMVGFVQSWFLVFTFGAVFSEFLTRSGSVSSIAYKLMDVFGKKRAMLLVAVISCVLSIGGVNAYVMIFMIWPICVLLCKETQIPRGIWIGIFYLGMFAGMVFPGNPGMVNVVVSQGLQVSSASSPAYSFFIFILYFGLGMVYFRWQANRWKKKGIVYVEKESDKKFSLQTTEGTPGICKALAPMLTVIILFTLLSPSMGSTNALLISMVAGTVLCILLNFKVLKPQLKEALITGSGGGVNPTMTAAVVCGYLGMVTGSPAFQQVANGVMSISSGPYMQAFAACNIMAFVTGSGSAATVSILNAFQEAWLSAGVNTSILRGLMTVCLCGASLSPHCGGLHGVMGFTNSDLKETYIPVFGGVLCTAVITGLIGALIATFFM